MITHEEFAKLEGLIMPERKVRITLKDGTIAEGIPFDYGYADESDDEVDDIVLEGYPYTILENDVEKIEILD